MREFIAVLAGVALTACTPSEFKECGCSDRSAEICVLSNEAEPRAAIAAGEPGTCVAQPSECDAVFDAETDVTIPVECHVAICDDFWPIDPVGVASSGLELHGGAWFAGCIVE